MLYSVLIYDAQDVIDALPEEEVERRLNVHRDFQKKHAAKLGPIAKLLPPTSAVTLKGGPIENTVLDGPFAETKEQLLGFYLIECESLEEAIETARQLPHETGSLEVRPVEWFNGD